MAHREDGAARPAREHTPRERIVYAAAQLIRRNGVSGTGLREIVARADAPWGSLSHYFPRGKDQVVEEAVVWSSEYAAGRVRGYLGSTSEPTPSGLLAHMLAQWQLEFAARGFERGCPLVATTADVVGRNPALGDVVAQGFRTWRAAVASALEAMGVPAPRCEALATVTISALEGAIVLARAQRDAAPLASVAGELGPLLDAAAGR